MKFSLPFLPDITAVTARRLLRSAAILLAVLLLHLLGGIWGSRHVAGPANPTPPDIMTISLEAPPAPQPPPPPPPKPRPKPPKPPKPHPAPTPPPLPAPDPEPAITPSLPPPAAAPPPVITGDQGSWQTDALGQTGSSDNATASPAIPATATTPLATAPASQAHAADAPPSVVLKYDVQGLRDGQKVYGSGKIVWRNEDGRYRIDGSASVLFFTLLQFSSVGVLDDFGVSPTLYTEKRFHKTATDTRFEHTRNTITFSDSDNSYPRPGNAQDRASIVWQLAAIGRGNPAAFYAGAEFTMFVAGVRDAEPWRIVVSGKDDAGVEGSDDSDSNQTGAWHLVRTPQPGSRDQTIDIWLAPQQQWYPVKIRQTESSGDYLEMSLSGQAPLPTSQ